MAWELRGINTDSAITLSQKALQLAKQRKWPQGRGQGHNNLGWFQYLKGDYTIAHRHLSKALTLWNRQGNKKKKAVTLGNIGNVYKSQGNYNRALEYYFKALKIDRNLDNKSGITADLVNIGNVYKSQGNYPKALEYYFKGVKKSKELDNKREVAIVLANIGIIYQAQGNYPKALEYYFKALKIDRKLDNKRGVAITLGNIAVVYNYQDNYLKALEYNVKSLKIDREIGNKRGIARNLGNIGEIYTILYEQPDSIRRRVLQATFPRLSSDDLKQSLLPRTASLLLDTALILQKKSMRIRKAIGDKNGLIYSYNSIGHILQVKGKYQGALHYYSRAYRGADSIGMLGQQKMAAKRLSEVYQEWGKPGLALKWYQRYTAHKDSLFNEQKQKEVGRLEARHKWQKKQIKDSLQHAKELRAQQLKHQHEIQQQRYMLYSAGAGLLLVLVFSGILYNRFRITQQQRDVIEQQNEEITSSINYAKHIQDALLSEEEKE